MYCHFLSIAEIPVHVPRTLSYTIGCFQVGRKRCQLTSNGRRQISAIIDLYI